MIHSSPGADHGTTSRSNGTVISVKEITAAVAGSPDYKPGMPIRMVSCFAGAGKVDGKGYITDLPLAQRVANGLKTDVQASPFKITETLSGGQVIRIQERAPQGMRDVQWQTYSPGRTPEIRSISPFGY